MQGGSVIELARQAAAAARDERGALPPLPARRYRGVQRRGSRYVATVWDNARKRAVWLGSYATPLEAAYAYDAGARRVHGRWARPNFPDHPAARRPAARATALAAAVRALEDLVRAAGRAQVPAAARQQQPAPRAQVPFPHWAAPAPAGAAAQPQRTPPGVFPYQRAATPFSPYSYRPGSSPAAAIYAAAYGAAYFEMTLLPGAYAAPELNRPASTALSSAGRVGASLFSAAAPERLIEPDQAVVGDNFTDDGASSSATRALFW